MSQICQGSSFLNFFLLFPLLLWCRFSAFFSAFPSVKNRMINKYPICCSNNAFFFREWGSLLLLFSSSGSHFSGFYPTSFRLQLLVDGGKKKEEGGLGSGEEGRRMSDF